MSRKRKSEENQEIRVKEYNTLPWIHASRTRNFALKNTLDDFLDLTRPKSEHVFFDALMQKGKDFETYIISELSKEHQIYTIVESIDNLYENLDKYDQMTQKAIKDKHPIIYQGLLLDPKRKILGIPDLLVLSNYLPKIFKHNDFSEIPKNVYVVVDIKHSSLEFCVNSYLIRNSGSVPAFKTQLCVYKNLLAGYQKDNVNNAYILGKRTESTILGEINYDTWDNKYEQIANDAIEWLRELDQNKDKWNLLPKPSNKYLYPNLKVDSSWFEFKKEYAMQIKDLTLLWYCGVEKRNLAHSKSIYSFSNRKCNSNNLGIFGDSISYLLDKIIKINQGKKLFDFDVKKFKLPKEKLRIVVDIETVNRETFGVGESSYIFMIGLCYKYERFSGTKCFILEDLNEKKQNELLEQFYKYIRDLTDKFYGKGRKLPVLFHYTKYEPQMFNKIFVSRKNTKILNSISWFDVHKLFKECEFVVKGCFNFKLKDLAKALHSHGLIKNFWKGSIVSGNKAMILAETAYENNDMLALKELEEYNLNDCIILKEIIEFLEGNIFAH